MPVRVGFIRECTVEFKVPEAFPRHRRENRVLGVVEAPDFQEETP